MKLFLPGSRKYLSFFLFCLFFIARYAEGQNLYPVSVQRKWGYINDAGVVCIQPQFEQALSFEGPVAWVKVSTDWRLINRRGLFMGEIRVKHSAKFSEGVAVIHFGGKYGYIDTNGVWFQPPTLDSASERLDAVSAIVTEGKPGLLTSEGSVLLFGYAEGLINLGDSLVGLKGENGWSICNWKGEEVSRQVFDKVKPSPGLGVVVYTKKKCGVIDRKGRWIYKPVYDEITPPVRCVLGRYVLKKNHAYIIGDENGRRVSRTKYDALYRFSEDCAIFRSGSQLGVIDAQGRVVIAPAYELISDFKNGLAFVMREDKFGIINTEGEIIIPLNFDRVDLPAGGLIPFYANAAPGQIMNQSNFVKLGYLNMKGEVVWQPQF